MNILLLGSGGREHAIAWKIKQSIKFTNLWIASGNAGTSECGTNVTLQPNDFESIRQFVLDNKVNMLVVGPEDPLVNGIHDYFLENEDIRHIPVIGPVKAGAMLEGSKDFAKGFMKKYNIPTAAYKTFSPENINESYEYLKSLNSPYVLKADGLAQGKGVVICNTYDEAKTELDSMILDLKFGDASRKVVIEEFLKGIEVSVFILTDGKSYIILPTAKDYKKAGEQDSGLNTGGMGSVSGVPFADENFMKKVEDKIIKPTVEGLKAEGIKYKGFLYFGLMNVKGEPFVIEYNVRMGDPETEAVIPRIKTDIVELFQAVADENLNEKNIEIDERFSVSVMLVSGGYPGTYEKGKVITGFEKVKNSILFHAGTAFQSTQNSNPKTITNGGRVIAITSFGNTLKEALEISYKNAERIDFEGKYYRRDIGFDLFNTND